MRAIAVRITYVRMEADVVEYLNNQTFQSPEDLLAEVEGMLESGEYTPSEIKQYVKDHIS